MSIAVYMYKTAHSDYTLARFSCQIKQNLYPLRCTSQSYSKLSYNHKEFCIFTCIGLPMNFIQKFDNSHTCTSMFCKVM